MPDIALLEPRVLRGVVEKFTTPQTMMGLNLVPRGNWPFPTATWDVVRGSRNMAKPNVPNSEAHIVPKLTVSQESAAFIYLREKKVFEPTTIHWLRTPGDLAARNAEANVLREVRDLDLRFETFAEFCIWQAMRGTLVLDFPDVQAAIDYKFPASHKPTVAVSWATATIQQISGDVKAWKRLIARDGRVPARQVFTSEKTLEHIFRAATADAAAASLLSDRQKDNYFTTGQLNGFLGLDWTPNETIFEEDNGTQTQFIPDDSLIMTNLTDNRPMELLEGPSADDEAPSNFTGKFTKTWKEKDPSARQYLMEWSILPVITRPEQFVYVADLTPTP